jgi:hypothetical protein
MRTRGAEIGAQISDDKTEAEWAECPQCEHQGWMGTYCLQCEDQGMIHFVAVSTNHRKETGSCTAAADLEWESREPATSNRSRMPYFTRRRGT